MLLRTQEQANARPLLQHNAFGSQASLRGLKLGNCLICGTKTEKNQRTLVGSPSPDCDVSLQYSSMQGKHPQMSTLRHPLKCQMRINSFPF